MLVWNIKKCLGVFHNCYVSSEEDEMLRIAEDAGATPLKRPSELCGEVPNILVYQYVQKTIDADVIVAVQACSPTIEQGLLEMAREIMLMGTEELMTCHPVEHKKNYHAQNAKIYGSIWALSRNRLKNYGDPYKPKPEVLLVDDSIDIHYLKDLQEAEEKWLATLL